MEIAHFTYPAVQPAIFLKMIKAAVDCASDETHFSPKLQQRLMDAVQTHWPVHSILGSDIRKKMNEGHPVVVHEFPFCEPQMRHGLYLALSLTIDRLMTHDGQVVIWPISPKSSDSDFGTYSENPLEAPLHTDGMYKKKPPRYVGMLAVRQADLGGETILASAYDVYSHLSKTDKGKKALSTLRRVFPVRVPSVYARGREPQFIYRAPFQISSSSLIMRFREDVLADGLRSCVATDSEEKRVALEMVSGCLKGDQMRQSLVLSAGQLLFVNNQTTLHGRTKFDDPTRLLERVWFR